MSEISIKIDGHEIPWSKPVITPKNILELGDKPEPFDNYIIFKIEGDKKQEIWNGTEKNLHKEIKAEDGTIFDIESKFEDSKIHYTVNREKQEILEKDNPLTVAQILEKAQFVPLEKFKLFNSKTEENYTDSNQKIKIQNGDEFLALSSGPITVA